VTDLLRRHINRSIVHVSSHVHLRCVLRFPAPCYAHHQGIFRKPDQGAVVFGREEGRAGDLLAMVGEEHCPQPLLRRAVQGTAGVSFGAAQVNQVSSLKLAVNAVNVRGKRPDSVCRRQPQTAFSFFAPYYGSYTSCSYTSFANNIILSFIDCI